MQEKELQAIMWTWGILIGIIGSLLVFSGGVLGYFIKRIREDNDSAHSEIRKSHDDTSKVILLHEIRLTKIETQHELEEKVEGD